MNNYKVPLKGKNKYVEIHECDNLRKVEDIEVRRINPRQPYFDLCLDDYEVYISIDYCPYCGCKLSEQEYNDA